MLVSMQLNLFRAVMSLWECIGLTYTLQAFSLCKEGSWSVVSKNSPRYQAKILSLLHQQIFSSPCSLGSKLNSSPVNCFCYALN